MVAQQAVNDIWGCTDETCGGVCSNPISLCEDLILGCDAVSGDVADVVYTANNGDTWTDTAAQPFGNDENVISVTCFAKDNTTTRYLVVRDTDGATNAEIAYSDDTGATWTNVDVESTGSFLGANDSGALFALDYRHIWLVLTGGYIVFSSDGGVTWTMQEEANIGTDDYNAVHFSDTNHGYAVADSGVVVKTDNGGETWKAVTAITGTPNVLCVYVFDEDNVIVGDNGGDIWRSWDGGTTWTQLYTGSTAINDISFANDFVGFALDGDEILRTRNGGEDWESLSGLPALTELNAVWVCDSNTAYVVGEDDSNLGIVFKVA